MELSQQQIENIENYIAFEGLVELLHWEDTSGYGFKVKLGLDDRAKLDPFDGTRIAWIRMNSEWIVNES